MDYFFQLVICKIGCVDRVTRGLSAAQCERSCVNLNTVVFPNKGHVGTGHSVP